MVSTFNILIINDFCVLLCGVFYAKCQHVLKKVLIWLYNALEDRLFCYCIVFREVEDNPFMKPYTGTSATGQEIYQAFRSELAKSTIRVIGEEDLYDLAEIRLMTAILAVFGQSERGFLYAEPSLLDAHLPPPDLVLGHPATGVIVFECKAYGIDFLHGMEAGSLKIMRNGREVRVNPLRQAQRGMFAIKDAFDKFAYRRPRPLFHAVVALPNIREDEWNRLGYHRCMDGRVVLFEEHLQDAAKLEKRLLALVRYTQQRVNNTDPFPTAAESVLFRVFGDSAVINDARQVMRELDPKQLGAEIDALEQQHKDLSSEQQYLSRLDTWGYPHLVRGVAGSGKSVVLANQVARTIYRFQKQQAQLPLFDDDSFRPKLPRIGVVCFNRSLVSLLRTRIETAYLGLTGNALPEESVTVTDLNRLLYSIGEQVGKVHFQYVGISKVRHAGARAKRHIEQLETIRAERPDLFEKICFDGIFIDEGQDAHPTEYMLLQTLVRPDSRTDERSITIFYDDAQNLFGNPPPTWRNLSVNIAGGRAAFMQHCYRNSREILELGLNVLLGTEARQRHRVATRRFVDIHSLKEKQLVEETELGWRVRFADESGIEPNVRSFASRFEQLDWIAEAVVALLEDEGVRPEHILILAPRATSFNYLSQRIAQLCQNPIPLRVVGGSFQHYLDELLVVPDQLTLATIHAAKGYDAPIAFLIDVDQLDQKVLGRVMFYVAVTRAKRYLMMTGLDLPNTLMREAVAVAEKLNATNEG